MFNQIIQSLKLRKAFRETYNELSKMSNRELDDIGIPRSMITRIAMDSAKKTVGIES